MVNDEVILPSKSITVEAWITLGAYPWNWATIITIGKYNLLNDVYELSYIYSIPSYLTQGYL